MTTPAPIWKGKVTGLKEQPDSGAATSTAEKRTLVLIYVGTYAEALAAQPAVRATVEGVSNAYAVESSSVSKMSGGRGKLTINMQAVPLFVEWPEPETPPEPVYEVDWIALQKRIETHEFFNDLSMEDRATVEDAFSERDQKKRETLLAKIQNNDLAMKLYNKKMKGEESYEIFTPVVRATTKNVSGFTCTGAGNIEDPPSAANPPSGWQYLKTADRVVSVSLRKDKWELHEEWTGAKEWDEDLYSR